MDSAFIDDLMEEAKEKKAQFERIAETFKDTGFTPYHAINYWKGKIKAIEQIKENDTIIANKVICPLCGEEVSKEDIEDRKTEQIKKQLYHEWCILELGRLSDKAVERDIHLWND